MVAEPRRVSVPSTPLAATEDAQTAPELPRSVCGPNQVSYVSAPLAEQIRVAGNFSMDLTVSSNLPGGNLVATLSHTAASGSCTELASGIVDSGRIQLDLRHWADPGASRPFPTGRPTRVRAESLPLAAVIPAGARLVLTIGAGSAEILPDVLKPRITIATGPPLARVDLAPGRVRPAAIPIVAHTMLRSQPRH